MSMIEMPLTWSDTPTHQARGELRFSCFSLPPSWAVVLVSAILAYGDRRAVAGADGPGVRVVGEGDACGAQLVDQACCLAWGGDLHGAVGQRLVVAVEEDGQGGQVR